MLKHCIMMKDGKCIGLDKTYCKRNVYCEFYKDKRNMTAKQIGEFEEMHDMPSKYYDYSGASKDD